MRSESLAHRVSERGPEVLVDQEGAQVERSLGAGWERVTGEGRVIAD